MHQPHIYDNNTQTVKSIPHVTSPAYPLYSASYPMYNYNKCAAHGRRPQ